MSGCGGFVVRSWVFLDIMCNLYL